MLWERLHEPLFRRLRPNFWGLDETDIRDVVLDVILAYAEHSERYDPSKSRLDSYLAMAAQGDLLNLVEKLKRRPKAVPIDDVAEPELERNSRHEEETRRIREALAALMPRICEILPEPTYREVLELMADGVRDSRRFAEVLRCTDLEVAEQRRRVKQAKDLIRLRLKRGGTRIEGDGDDGDD